MTMAKGKTKAKIKINGGMPKKGGFVPFAKVQKGMGKK